MHFSFTALTAPRDASVIQALSQWLAIPLEHLTVKTSVVVLQ